MYRTPFPHSLSPGSAWYQAYLGTSQWKAREKTMLIHLILVRNPGTSAIAYQALEIILTLLLAFLVSTTSGVYILKWMDEV